MRLLKSFTRRWWSWLRLQIAIWQFNRRKRKELQ